MLRRALLSVMIVCGLVTTGSARTLIEVGYATSADSHYGVGMQRFAEVLDELSGGTVGLVQHPAASLGGEREMIEAVQLGILDMVITSTGPLANFVPETQVLDLPFLFRDYDHARAVLDGEIGQELLAAVNAQGFHALAWSENGFRHVTNSKHPVHMPQDLAGMKIRTMENPIHLRAFEALGAAPTPMSFAELFTALQQGVVDAQENPVVVITMANFAEVQRYLTLTGHLYSPAIILMSTARWDGLDDQQRGWVLEAATQSVAATRGRVDELEATGVAQLRAQGMEVVTDVDKAPFQAAVAPAYDTYTSRFGRTMIDRIEHVE